MLTFPPDAAPREKHLRHVKQLSFGWQNAEAYFSYDGRRLIFMSTREPYQCDQIFIPGRKHVVYSSTLRSAR
jgi:TolB protein